jgi:hypothetical protein
MAKRSDLMIKGPERAPHRSFLKAAGFPSGSVRRIS